VVEEDVVIMAAVEEEEADHQGVPGYVISPRHTNDSNYNNT